MPEPRTAVVISGRGRYSDPWHPFAETSERIAATLRAELDLGVRVVPTTPEDLAALADAAPDLLVVDAGGGHGVDGPDPDWADATAAIERLLAAGVPLLATHAAANAFTDVPAYRAALGGRWVNGVSFHPDRGPAHFAPASEHPILAGLEAVDVPDEERYSALELDDDVTPLLTHEHDGVTHVSAWARESARGRAVYDGLGHYGPSYDAAARNDLLVREARWLLDG